MLHAHSCFAVAPPGILDDVARFAGAEATPAERRMGARRIRGWQGVPRASIEEAPGSCQGTGPEQTILAALFEELNRRHFPTRPLPPIPLRISRRMTRRLGHVRLGGVAGGPRRVIEIAIARRLLRPHSADHLRDTLLHEMAHAEAWLVHGHRGHGSPWKAVARRVGCEPRARAAPFRST